VQDQLLLDLLSGVYQALAWAVNWRVVLLTSARLSIRDALAWGRWYNGAIWWMAAFVHRIVAFMAPSLLANLALTPTQVAALPAAIVRRVLHFLLRWEAFADLLVCLEQMSQPPGDAALLRARALQGLGRTAEAQQVLQARLQTQPDPATHLALAELALEDGDPDQAQAHLAHALPPMRHLSRTWWLAVRIHLARGDDAAAQQAIQQLTALAPESPYLSLSMMARLRTRGDTVTATAYAVAALDADRRDAPLAVESLVELRAFFTATRDRIHLAEVETRLVQRFEQERGALLADLPRTAPEAAARSARAKPAPHRVGIAFDFAAHRRRDGCRTPGAAQGSAHQLRLCRAAARSGRNPDVRAPRRTRAGDPADRRRQVALLPTSRLQRSRRDAGRLAT
jgi:tetratricopeptide (TPR) repeat protein